MKELFDKKTKVYTKIAFAVLSGASLLGITACDDSTSAEKESDYVVVIDDDESSSSNTTVNSSESGTSSSSSATANSATSSSTNAVPPPVVSSSSKTATQSSEEELNPPSDTKIVNGSCAPKTAIINKGELATWEFYRESGDVFDVIMAPFVWKFPEMSKTVQGNGMNSVNIAYNEAGTFTATLNVDGNEVVCDTLQVQGIPINITSCKADKSTANAGEVVTWTVEASSEAEIVSYAWSYEGGEVSGNGTTGAVTLGSDLHKVNVAPTVTVTNADKTSQRFACDATYVINPNKVDYEFIKGGDHIDIPSQEVWVVQIPADCANCTLVCETKGSLNVFINDEAPAEQMVDYYRTPAGPYDGQKVQFLLQTNASTAECYITPW